MTTRVVAAGADDWELTRGTRLAALGDAPSAFASTYAREAAFTEAQWRARIREDSVTYLARDSGGPADGTVAGMAGGILVYETPELVGMWVRPDRRGRGVGDALVEAVAAWAGERGYPALSLWVTKTNEPARRLYERLGFVATGEYQPLPSNPALAETRMRRAL
jgi:GNAT superfamily N-acetyltransferase